MAGTVQQAGQKPSCDSSDLEVGGDRNINAFVGKGVEFRGTLTYDGTIRIDGSLEGEVQTEGCLLVGQGAVVTAKITAGTVICKGTIIGDVIAKEKVHLRSPGVLKGSVTTPKLSLEEGVLFNGTIEMAPSDVSLLWERQYNLAGAEPHSGAQSAA